MPDIQLAVIVIMALAFAAFFIVVILGMLGIMK